MKDVKKIYEECTRELMKIDITKKGYVKQFENLYNKYGVDVVNAVRENLY